MTSNQQDNTIGGSEQLQSYVESKAVADASSKQLNELEQNKENEVLQKQLDLLKRRLVADPQSFRQMFIGEGMDAIAWEFKQDALGADFTKTLWNLLLAGDDASVILQRFIWDVPLKFKRKFIRAIDEHLSDRYPLFKGLSEGWPGENGISPYVRPAEERSTDFTLVNQGYLGYMNLGYSAREVELLVWLEVLRDKQCDDRPCEIGIPIPGKSENKGGCPVKIHIPEMLNLLGTGRYKQALQLIESCNPLPNVTGRVCPQELQCQGVCTLNNRPIEI
ncbi:MAG: 2-polyprenylphenol hydroxylase, partial [Alphaproteobacteria bacterium]